jgi:hypothetical protein
VPAQVVQAQTAQAPRSGGTDPLLVLDAATAIGQQWLVVAVRTAGERGRLFIRLHLCLCACASRTVHTAAAAAAVRATPAAVRCRWFKWKWRTCVVGDSTAAVGSNLRHIAFTTAVHSARLAAVVAIAAAVPAG